MIEEKGRAFSTLTVLGLGFEIWSGPLFPLSHSLSYQEESNTYLWEAFGAYSFF